MIQHNEGERKAGKMETGKRERKRREHQRGKNVTIDGENRDVVTLEVEDDDMT